MTNAKRSKNGPCDIFIGREEFRLLGGMGSEREPCGVDEDGKNLQFSNSNKASFCRSFINTRDSRLLIVYGSEQAETLRQETKSKGGDE